MMRVNSNRGYKTPALIIPLIKDIKYILKGSGALQHLKAVYIPDREAYCVWITYLL